MKLLPLNQLIKTGPVDHADWNYSPVLGWIQKLRFRLALSLLPSRSASLLEIGYGSGIFMPSLSALTSRLVGIDIHDKFEEVNSTLQLLGITSELRMAPAERIPFADESFDAVVAVSSLEFVSDLNASCLEIARVMRRDGTFVVITPGSSKVLDLGLKLLTGENAKSDFGDRRAAIVSTLQQHFTTEKAIVYPPLLGSIVPLYKALRLKKKATAHSVRANIATAD